MPVANAVNETQACGYQSLRSNKKEGNEEAKKEGEDKKEGTLGDLAGEVCRGLGWWTFGGNVCLDTVINIFVR